MRMKKFRYTKDAISVEPIIGSEGNTAPCSQLPVSYSQPTAPGTQFPPNSQLMTPGSQPPFFSSQIDGIDLERGIKRFGGNESAYAGVLRLYARNIPSLLETVLEVNENSPANYAILVHGIRGASLSICADATAGMAEALEAAARTGDYAYINKHNAEFIKTARDLILGINAALIQPGKDKAKPKRKMPDRKTLGRLLDACISHDMDSVDTAVAELDAYTYESGGDLASWLKENAERMNYAVIAEKLSASLNDFTLSHRGSPLCSP